jgi:DNA replication protein DnaC
MKECENCQYACPWIPTGDNTAKRCPIYFRKKSEEKILQMVLKSGRDLDRCPKFEDLNFTKAEPEFKEGLEQIKSIHTNLNHLFFIWSPPGTGKTHCLLAYAFQMLRNKFYVHYLTASRLRDIWLEIMNRHRVDNFDDSEINLLMDSEILIIDEFCHEGVSLSGHFQRYFEGILTSTAKKVILASNVKMTAENFPYKNEDWIMDRLNHAVKITWFGESFREPKK